jgi:hypothetical protein
MADMLLGGPQRSIEDMSMAYYFSTSVPASAATVDGGGHHMRNGNVWNGKKFDRGWTRLVEEEICP